MPSKKQIAANRRNAQKSTGPTSVEGKENSKFNALKHGLRGANVLLPWEDKTEYLDHCTMYLEGLRVKTPLECKLALRIAENNWRLDRAGGFETAIIRQSQCREEMLDELLKITLYESRLERDSDRCMRQLLKLQKLRREHPFEADEAILMPDIRLASAETGPSFPKEMPRDKEEGRYWKAHLDDVALSCRETPPSEYEVDSILRRGGYGTFAPYFPPSHQVPNPLEIEEETPEPAPGNTPQTLYQPEDQPQMGSFDQIVAEDDANTDSRTFKNSKPDPI